MRVRCAHCGSETDKPTGAVNRAWARGLLVYCNRKCAGLGRRMHKSKERKIADKAAYDAEYRTKNRERLRAEKSAYYQRTHDPVKEAEKRKERMPYHVEYCRRPEYREWKRDYDRQYRAVKNYGDFADCFLLVMDIRDECLSQMSDYEIRYAKGGFGKTQQRKRDYARTHSQEPEVGPLGDIERYQGRKNGSLTG